MGESGGTTSSTRRRGAGYMHHDSWVALGCRSVDSGFQKRELLNYNAGERKHFMMGLLREEEGTS